MAEEQSTPAEADDTGLGGGSYDVIRARLQAHARELVQRAAALNEQRQEIFGGSELTIVGTERIRTQNNCVPRDIVSVGGRLLFGYNVFLGLKHQTVVSDVLGLYRFERGEGLRFVLEDAPELTAFLTDPRFDREFRELYQYYKDTSLHQLQVSETQLLAVFHTGDGWARSDFKVFRWAVEPDGGLSYVDSRGERDWVAPATHDFEWQGTSRSDHILGHHPHVSIEDTVFVETVGGDLTVKVEDNTEDGEGIYREPVDDLHQSLDDAEIRYARVGALILMAIQPYQEEVVRHLIYNTRTRKVVRVDAIGDSCVQLPEDHGVIFPGGYCLDTGDVKVFSDAEEGLHFTRKLAAPNGEDVLYVFHRPQDGLYVLYPYNLIRKEVSSPIRCHGWSLADDGDLSVFRGAAGDPPTRVHPVQVWSTPYVSAEVHARQEVHDSLLGRVGNAELVRGISECNTLARLADETQPTRAVYEAIVQQSERVLDAHYWLGEGEVGDLREGVLELRSTAELIIDEFEKVQTLRAQARQALREADAEAESLFNELRPDTWDRVEQFMDGLTSLRTQRGRLITLKELRFIDLERVDAIEQRTVDQFDAVSQAVVAFLLEDRALAPLMDEIVRLLERIETVHKVSDFEPVQSEQERLAAGLDLLTEVVSGLQVDDATARAAILEKLSEVFGQLNRARAVLQGRKKSLGADEARADFSAQFKLLGQAVASAVAMADTPEACDEQLSRLMLQLEDLEARFGEYDEFLPDLATKRDEVYEALGARKQTLLDARSRRVGNLVAAADRILGGIARRAGTFKEEQALQAFFASDAMVMKLRQIAGQLTDLGDGVKGEELLSRLMAARQDALRALRDKAELFAGGDNLITLGRHQFPVNTQGLELTMLPHDGVMRLHLTGTDFAEDLDDPAVDAFREFWDQQLISEDATVSRAEYLAGSLLLAAEAGEVGITVGELEQTILSADATLKLVRAAASERYGEGYERGVHDVDAAALLKALVTLRGRAGLLRFPPRPRVLAALFWAWQADVEAAGRWRRRARSLGKLRAVLGEAPALRRLAAELGQAIGAWADEVGVEAGGASLRAMAGAYLVEELVADELRFNARSEAASLRDSLLQRLDLEAARAGFEADLSALAEHPAERLDLAFAWASSHAADLGQADDELSLEAAALLVTGDGLAWTMSSALTEQVVEGLLSQHPNIVDRSLTLRLDEFLLRLSGFRDEKVPGFRSWRELRGRVLAQQRRRLRLDEFQPRVMSSFVRNKLINEVYLPLVGDNLAKQMGSAGAGKRTDQMGLLLLVSPPGYGKTTLMEYIANRLGLVFMKVNGPALGHEVVSLDPAEAPNATARQEVEKLNLGLEMGNNVMLYLDDIQHTNSELLQKFISLCDAQRKIEGVWKGRTRTYDMRGKKFCVVMAGNPYTESGERFQIPDMLANRADTYNLGDILDGKGDAFSLSYIENSLTSNPALAPLAARPQTDVYKLIEMARGREIPASELSHSYSSVELGEIVALLRQALVVQDVVLQVNQMYIQSAAQEDAYRVEPPFKLQGSYRNMNKLVEKLASAMNAEELQTVLDNHYVGEAQTLTTGAEQNLLKLAEMRGRLSDEERARWDQIKSDYQRNKLMGGGDDDPVTRISGVLSGLDRQLEDIAGALRDGSSPGLEERVAAIGAALGALDGTLKGGSSSAGRGLAEVSEKLEGVRGELRREQPLDLSSVSDGLTRLEEVLRAAARGLADLNVLQWMVPGVDPPRSEPEVAAAQREVLVEAQRAMGVELADEPLDRRSALLASSLPVIQDLFSEISELLGQVSISRDEWETMMAQLRQHVGKAVTRLASDEGEADNLDEAMLERQVLRALKASEHLDRDGGDPSLLQTDTLAPVPSALKPPRGEEEG